MKYITATNKNTSPQYVWVDDEDYGRVSAHNWYIRLGKNNSVAGIITHIRVNNERRVVTIGSFILEAYTDKTAKVVYIDGNKLNNIRGNLLITHYEGIVEYDDKHYGVKLRPGTSRFRGVCLNRSGTRYIPTVKYEGKRVYLGTYPNTATGEMDAAIARDMKVLELYGGKAILNFPRDVLKSHYAARVTEKFISGNDGAGWSVDIPITPRTTKHVGEYDTLSDAVDARDNYIINWGGDEALDMMLNQTTVGG
jgi:hypothetical protein